MAGMKVGAGRSRRLPFKLPNNLAVRIAWEARRIWRRLGWVRAIAVLSLLASAFLSWQSRQLEQRQQVLAKKLTALRSSIAAKPARAMPEDNVEQQLHEFYAYLPPHDAIPDRLKLLVNLAQKNGVTLAQAEYKPQPETSADFLRYQIVLPVKAAYPDVLAFIRSALRELPTLTLDSVTFKRERIESADVEARIECTLLVKKPASKGGQS